MRADYLKLVKLLFVGCLVIYVLDLGIGTALQYLETRMRGGERSRTFYAVNKAEAEVYVFGSSRALYHYNPAIMKQELGLEVYNAGRAAQTMLYHLPVLKMILKRTTPKLVILDVNESEFVKDQRKYDIVNFLLPYYKQDSTVRVIVDGVKPAYKFFSWSRILPYNSSAFAMLWRTIRPLQNADINGYTPAYGHRNRGDILFS